MFQQGPFIPILPPPSPIVGQEEIKQEDYVDSNPMTFTEDEADSENENENETTKGDSSNVKEESQISLESVPTRRNRRRLIPPTPEVVTSSPLFTVKEEVPSSQLPITQFTRSQQSGKLKVSKHIQQKHIQQHSTKASGSANCESESLQQVKKKRKVGRKHPTPVRNIKREPSLDTISEFSQSSNTTQQGQVEEEVVQHKPLPPNFPTLEICGKSKFYIDVRVLRKSNINLDMGPSSSKERFSVHFADENGTIIRGVFFNSIGIGARRHSYLYDKFLEGCVTRLIWDPSPRAGLDVTSATIDHHITRPLECVPRGYVACRNYQLCFSNGDSRDWSAQSLPEILPTDLGCILRQKIIRNTTLKPKDKNEKQN